MRALAVTLALLAATPARASAQATGGLQVTPVVIEMQQARGFASFRVHNGRATETAFEAEAFAWRQDDGGMVLTPTTDVVVAPSTFVVGEGGDQIVRLAVPARARHGATEQSYRIVLRELPNPDAPPTNGFRLIVEMSMPLFVTPPGAHGALQMRRGRDPNGAPTLVLTNTGAARLNLSDAADAARIDRLPRYLLAGAAIVRPLPLGVPSLLVASAGDTALRRQTLELSDAAHLADTR